MTCNDPVHFIDLQAGHLPMLREWLARPHVAHWWQPLPSIGELEADYIAVQGEPNATRAYLAHEGDEPIGFIQSYVVMGSGDGWWKDETDPGARGIDQFLADEHRLGQGLGRRMIRSFVEQLFADPAVTVVQTDPAPHNTRAIRCYRAAGFSDVGEVMTPDGPALLMRWRRPSSPPS
jgi:RimJ/RimL family protein N-acetyltransferase